MRLVIVRSVVPNGILAQFTIVHIPSNPAEYVSRNGQARSRGFSGVRRSTKIVSIRAFARKHETSVLVSLLVVRTEMHSLTEATFFVSITKLACSVGALTI